MLVSSRAGDATLNPSFLKKTFTSPIRPQLRIYLAALDHIEQTRESAILDFSIWSDIIFATKHHEDGYLTSDQFEEYKALSRSIFALKLPPPHLTVVLCVEPSICLERCDASETRSSRFSVSALPQRIVRAPQIVLFNAHRVWTDPSSSDPCGAPSAESGLTDGRVWTLGSVDSRGATRAAVRAEVAETRRPQELDHLAVANDLR